MSTDNEKWEDAGSDKRSGNDSGSFNKNESYNSGDASNSGEQRPYRPYGGDNGGTRPRRPRFNPNGEGGSRPQRAYSSSRDDRPYRPRYNGGGSSSYGGGQNRPYRPRYNNPEQDGGQDGTTQQRPQRQYGSGYGSNSYNNNGGDGEQRSYRPRYNNGGGSYGGNRGGYGNNRGYGNGGQQGSYRPRYNNYNNNAGGEQTEDGGEQQRPQRPQRQYGSNTYGGGYSRPQRRNTYGGGNYGGNRGGYGNNNGGYGHPQRRTADYNPNAKYSKKKQIEYQELNVDPDAPIRLNKFLANAGVCSRREADEFIQAGVVSVNGEVVTELGTKIKRSDVVKFHDQTVNLERKVYVLLNKPKDCVTTTDDPQERKTVMDLVKGACLERIYPVGRLDRNTTGVLLLTNDGDLASKLTHPKFLKKKVYQVRLDKDLTQEDFDKILSGVTLDDGEVHADKLEFPDETKRNEVGIEIHSGKNRIVRRIFESLGYRVVKLDRVLFAGLTKKGLRRGEWRYLTQQEVNFLQMGSFE